jgi:hypothetical protein
MNAAITIIAGIIIYIVLMWILLAVMRLEKTPHEDEYEDGREAEQRGREIAEATGPAPLERPHVRAGAPWGRV